MLSPRFTSEDIKSFGTSLLEATLGWAGASAFILNTIEYVIQLSSKADYNNSRELRATVVAFVGVLSLVDLYVHYRIYSHKRYDKPDDHHEYINIDESRCDHAHTHTDEKINHSDITPLIKPRSHDHFSFAAFICAFSCSIELVGVPTAVAVLFRAMNVLGELNKTQKITELSLSTLTIGFCIWAGSRRYSMSKNHLEHGNQHQCC